MCIICEKWGDGRFFQFRLSPEEEKNNDGFFGEPGLFYFCDEHSGLFWKYREHTKWEALPLMMEDFKQNAIPKTPSLFKIVLDRLARILN